eukprot:gene14022-43724_t
MELAALPGVLGMSASYFCQKLVRYSLLFWLPYYLSKQLGYSAVLAGYVSSAFDFGGIMGHPPPCIRWGWGVLMGSFVSGI